jgi:hypothetical protein
MPGYILESPTEFISTARLGLDLSNKLLRSLEIIHLNNNDFLWITLNNRKPELYKIQKWKK